MAELGYCPSGRLFEAAACGTPILSDWWGGLDEFFTPGSEILVAHGTDDAVAAVELEDDALAAIARRARERTLDEHTADHRAHELERAIEAAAPAAQDGRHAGPRRRRATRGPRAGAALMWGIVPAAGAGSRIQPLAFSKELLRWAVAARTASSGRAR
jgi:hypothetical protein